MRRQKAQIAAQRESASRAQLRAVLATLRAAIAQRRKDKRAHLQAVRERCRELRTQLRARVKQWRIELRDQIRAERVRVCTECDLSREQARNMSDAAILEAIKAYAAERGHQASLRREPGRPAKVVVRVRLAESDDEVRNNIDPELVPVWEAVRRRIRPGERSSRTEAFLQWVHDHAGDARRIMAEHHEQEEEREYRKMIERESRLTKAMKTGRAARAEDLEAIPF